MDPPHGDDLRYINLLNLHSGAAGVACWPLLWLQGGTTGKGSNNDWRNQKTLNVVHFFAPTMNF
jgi:hypothetical protein